MGSLGEVTAAEGCPFCEIARGTRPAHMVMVTDRVVAFMDQFRQPVDPAHVLVIPREHVQDIYGLDDALGADLFSAHARVARAVRTAFAPDGITTWSSNGPGAGQEVMHFHLHVFPRRRGVRLDDAVVRQDPEVPVDDDVLESAAAKIRSELTTPGSITHGSRREEQPADRRPRLVIVSGSPGAGKTTLAALLARELGLPFLTKDDMKEAIADAIPASDREASRRLGYAAYRVLFTVAARFIDAGAGLVLESNFERGRAEAELAPLVARTHAVLVQCEVPDALALERYQARAASGVRHGVHKDDIVIEMWARGIRSDHGALDLGVPVITIDTSDGYKPPLPEIVAAVRGRS